MEALDIFDDKKVKNEFDLAFNKLDEIEMIQLLSDLKYLPWKAFEDGIVQASEKINAIKRFRTEYADALNSPEMSNLNQIKFSSEIIEEEEQLPHQLSQREVHVLKELSGLDKELIIKDVKKEENSILSRVLIYRYRVYGLCKTILPNQKLTKTVIEKLQLSAEELGYTKNWVAFGNLLADQEKLSEFCTTSKVLTNNIFGDCIFLKLNSDKGKVVIKKFGNRIKAESLFHKSIASDSGKRIINDIIDHHKKEEVTSFIDTKMEQTPNEFMSRVLQVKLWTMGLYPGILDNDFGPVSLKALDDFLMTIVDKQIKGRKELGKILFNLQNNQCILNINYLLTTYLIPMEKSELNFKQSSVSQIFDFILEDKTSKNSLKNKQKIYARQNQLTRSLKKELHTESDKIINGEKRTVRLYKAKKGIMKFFSKLFKFLKNTYDQLVALFKKLMNLIKKVSKIIYDEIREAFKSFSDGLKFLFGKRNIKPTPYISSDFDFDFDCVTRIHSKPGLEDIEVHTKTISGYASAVYPTLNFVRIVIQWGLKFATGPIGWVKILIGIAKLFKEMHSRRTILQMA